ncbi:hypothetical protein HSBAA_41200 [Vreelandella sulfidaeris]|uniref:DUF3333 domain-containing protein n=1 Tax=Vreelandella sulfidaeris TaxID=115553 RepID=A0A455UIM7_9GAMM|nr:hypothetical protein HSBAA_41200 [Halomonas sulfidaeris]
MSHTFDEISQQLKRRHRKSARLKWISMGSLGLAGLFLVLFFADMLTKGLPAFQQAYVQVEINYTEEAATDGRQAFDEELLPIISRTMVRVIPMELRNNPGMIGTSEEQWVLATSEVDQYLKGHRNRLSTEQQETIDALVESGKVDLRFNKTFLPMVIQRLLSMQGFYRPWSVP